MLKYEVQLPNGSVFWCEEFGRVRDVRLDGVPMWVNPDVDFVMKHALLKSLIGFPKVRPVDVIYILEGVILAFRLAEPKTCAWDESIEMMADEIEGAE